ncbi:Bud-site selection protein [Microdochium trichocladiopsis]|uniref:Bud-site selection protein n=1 Tax=Microdochium trichocladiopsis TaxID=1682393 RepID=A0A9P8XYI4_9PEZI|nr:Bud-site selection protein [Microdochium trichocladiopsis]KAH7020859.1 Bud-site selection protein [Microdochium trichocladiopsis]
MPPQKRKRTNEPSLRDKLVGWNKELVRAFKTAKGFERQRLSKRIREGDAAKNERLEREVAVLKSIDLHQLAHQHLSSSLLRVKGVAESPNLPPEIKPIPKPESLSEEQRVALHNVTSGLCNRKQVRDVIEEAVMGTCIALRVPMPDKKKKGGGKGGSGEKTKTEDNDGGGKDKEKKKETRKETEGDDDGATEKKKQKTKASEDNPAEGLVLLKRKRPADEDVEAEAQSDDNEEDDGEEPVFEGFSDSEAEERAFAKYDALVGGSSDEDEDDVNDDIPSDDGADDGSEAGGDDSLDERMIARYDKLVAGSSDEDSDGDEEGDDDDDLLGSRVRAIRRVTADDISLSSGDEDEAEGGDDLNRDFSGSESDEAEYDVDGASDDSEEEDDEEDQSDNKDAASESDASSAPAPKKTKLSSSAAKTKTNTGSSAFLPTLMGGYISNSESEASDLDIAPSAKKNRRGQRARQAIWEKKYGDKAKHFSKPQASQNARDLGWDPRRGAVGEDGEGAAGPWKKGIRNPFEKKTAGADEGMHPERQRAIERGGNNRNNNAGAGAGRGDRGQQRQAPRGAGGFSSSRDGNGFAGRGGGGGEGRGHSSSRMSSRGGGRGGFSAPAPSRPPPPPTKRDDTGPLHPSWAAAKKAKEEAGKIAFQGKKVVFD